MKMSREMLRGFTSIAIFLLITAVLGTNIALSYSGVINSFMGVSTSRITSGGDGNGDTTYFKSDYGELSDSNLEKLIEDAYQQCVSEEEEGAVLLKNDNQALPLEASGRVTLFGRAVADPVYKPTSGAAPASGEHLITFHDAMADAGFAINETLFSAYENSSTVRIKAMLSDAYGDVLGSDIGEEKASFYTQNLKSSWENDYNDAAIVMLAREGGEDADLGMTDLEGISQLALHQAEKDLLEMIRSSGKFHKVIVILNSPWAMETGWLDEYGVDACLWIGNPGLRGFEGVANILTGKVNPSGKLVDTYASNSLSAPAITYATDNTPSYVNAKEVQEYCSDDDKYVSYYSIYAEGIYIGYKYYETRYEDLILGRYHADSTVGSSTGAAWNYEDEISFPFGFGLSYTEFEQKLDRVEEAEGVFTISATITNTGDTAGKSVVELYVQKPYEEYEIDNLMEASAVQLVGFAKTELLNPGESQQVEITVDKYLLASYDYMNAKGYVLSAGDFYFAIGDDAHDALNNILATKGAVGMYDHNGISVTGKADNTYIWNQETLDTKTYQDSAITGVTVTNQFTEADINYWIDDTFTYLSRSDWEATFPEEVVPITATDEMMVEINGYTYEKPEDSKAINEFTQGEDNGLSFVDMRNVEYDDNVTWDLFLNQLTIKEMCAMLSSDMSGTGAVTSVGMPSLLEGDGIDGIKNNYLYGDKRSATAYAGKAVLSSTWNYELVENRGRLMAEEAIYCNNPTIWCGGGNIHRTPFSGRNFEYYSEDGYLGYLLSSVELKAMQDKGVTASIKHFCGNDQEKYRESLATFFNEQSFRENNLRLFEGAFCNAKVLGTMQGFNRIGCTYIGQDSTTLVNVLRDEWGYKGKIITDAVANMSYKTHYAESLSAGTDYYCWDLISFGEATPLKASEVIYSEIIEHDDGNLLQHLRRANKNIYYALSQSIAINGLTSNSTIEDVAPWWQYALYATMAAFAVLTILIGGLYIKKSKSSSLVRSGEVKK